MATICFMHKPRSVIVRSKQYLIHFNP